MNLPNTLTLLRMAVIPVIILLLFAAPGDMAARGWALGLFAASAITDFFDGWLARRLQQESRLGRLLDPVADKLLVVLVLLALAASGAIAGWHLAAVFAIIFREILVSGLREFLAGSALELPVSRLAKYKTTAQLIAIALVIGAPALPAGGALLAALALWIATGLTLITGFGYLTVTLRHIHRGTEGI